MLRAVLSLMVAIIAPGLVFSAAGCGQNERAAPVGFGTVDTAGFGGMQLDAGDTDGTTKWPVDGDSWCAPDGSGVGIVSCCNDEPCHGQCYQGMDGAMFCDCYAAAGGCTDGDICCGVYFACTEPVMCEPP